MLQQILNDMYIDPELLAELDEEQKQILFCKMREEQVRRWKLREDQLHEEEEEKRIIHPKKNGGKKVTFLVGVDGEPVVLVLGGGGGSKEDVDSLLQERARRQADLEADLLKRAAEEELDKLVRLSRSTVQAMEEEATHTHPQERDPAREAVVQSLQEATVEMEGHIQALEEAECRQRHKLSLGTYDASHSDPGGTSSPASSVSSGVGSSLKSPLTSSASSSSLSSLSSGSSTSQPPSPPAFSISPYSHTATTRKLSGLNLWESCAAPRTTPPTTKPAILTPKPSLPPTSTPNKSPHSAPQPVSGVPRQCSPPSSLSSTASTLSSTSPPPSLCSPSGPPPPLTIVEKDDFLGLQHIPHSANSVIRRFEELCEGSLEALKTATLERAKKRRQKEILEQLRSQVEAAQSQVSTKVPAERDDAAWQEQERKAKEAERRIREIARRAREEHRRAASASSPPTHALNRNLSGLDHLTLLRNGLNEAGTAGGSSDINGNHKAAADDISNNNRSSRGGQSCVRQRLRPPKPPSRAAIITWFREEELTRGAGLDPSHSHVAPWFHGIISRTEAEEVLAGAAIGCFLVRVSERIWGYAISYRAPDRCRHYLIDVTGGKYTFFGSHQACHHSLSELVEHHCREPITASGGELLTRPCGQPNPSQPDYLELFTGTQYLNL